MKKTIHINLSGMAFQIEEDAFARLKSYLDAVEKELKPEEEISETLSDVEARMVELLIPVTGENEKAITLNDVDEIIKVLGAPEAFNLSGENEEETAGAPPPLVDDAKISTSPGKRLYRDPHSRILGGVCSGLGAYFGVDPVLFRLFFVLGIFLGPFFWLSVLPYLILWIVMPKALTIEQRMQMYGGDPLMVKGQSSVFRNSGINTFLRVVGVIIGIVLMLTTFVLMNLLAFAMFLPVEWIEMLPGGPEIGSLYHFLVPDVPWFLTVGIVLFLGIPLALLFYLGLQLVFHFKRGGKTIGAMGLLLWLSGIAMLSFGGVWMSGIYRVHEAIDETHLLQPIRGKTLYLKPVDIPTRFGRSQSVNINKVNVRFRDGVVTIDGEPQINVIRNAPQFALTIVREARGRSGRDAIENASMIEYFWLQSDSVLELDRIFTLPLEARFRNQKVFIELELPSDIKLEADIKLNINYKHR